MLRLVMYGMPAAQAFHQGIHLDISRLRFPAPEPPPEKFFSGRGISPESPYFTRGYACLFPDSPHITRRSPW